MDNSNGSFKVKTKEESNALVRRLRSLVNDIKVNYEAVNQNFLCIKSNLDNELGFKPDVKVVKAIEDYATKLEQLFKSFEKYVGDFYNTSNNLSKRDYTLLILIIQFHYDDIFLNFHYFVANFSLLDGHDDFFNN